MLPYRHGRKPQTVLAVSMLAGGKMRPGPRSRGRRPVQAALDENKIVLMQDAGGDVGEGGIGPAPEVGATLLNLSRHLAQVVDAGKVER